MTAKQQLQFGQQYPFDAPDGWWNSATYTIPPVRVDWARRAARGVIEDLKDRHTIKHALSGIDEATRVEIVDSLAEIIRTARELYG